MARRRNPLTSSNLDALMDTMTNVVGILIIVLILMQVNVSQALKKIVSELPEVTEAELLEVREEAAEQLAQHEKLKEVIDSQRRRADDEKRETAKLNAQLSTLETSAQASAVPIFELASIRGKVLENVRALEKAKRESAELLAEQQRLKALLDTTPVAPPPPDKIVRIPNSRAMPADAKLERYLVTGGQLYHYDPEAAKKLLLQEFQSARTRLEKEKERQADGTMKVIYDQEKVVNFFAQRQLTLRGMEVRVPANPTGTRLSWELIPKTGEPIAGAAQFASNFQTDLRRIKSTNAAAWFHVTKGAFDAYLTAREICENIGVAAGWELTNAAIYTEPITDFEVNRTVEPPPPRTPPTTTPRPTPVRPPGPSPTPPPPPPIKIDPPKKKLD